MIRFITILFATFLCNFAFGDTFTVDTLIDENSNPSTLSLRDALADSASGDTIRFESALNGGTILLQHGQLDFRKSLTIDASGLTRGIYLKGDGTSRILSIDGSSISPITVTVKRVAFTHGVAQNTRSGGGATVSGIGDSEAPLLSVEFHECHFEKNRTSAPGAGGSALSLNGNSEIKITKCSFIDNHGMGSSTINIGTFVTRKTIIDTSTFACNSTGVHPEEQSVGILETFGAGFEMNHCTLTKNIVQDNTLIIGGAASISNTIISGNFGTRLSGNLITSRGYNLVGDILPQFAVEGDVFSNDPKLIEPMQRGGFTHTCALRPDSPACDATADFFVLSDPLDQRGYPRYRNGDGDFFGSSPADIGAYELGETLIVTTSVDELGGLPDTGLSLREALVMTETMSPGVRIVFAESLHSSLNFFALNGTPLEIKTSVWIDGTGIRSRDDWIVIGASSLSRALRIAPHQSVTLENLFIRNGIAQGSESGGGIFVEESQALNLIDGYLLACNAPESEGGGIKATGNLNLLRSEIVSCRVKLDGGGIHLTGRLKAKNCIISSNQSALGAGGAICARGQTEMIHCTVHRNFSTGNKVAGLDQKSGIAEISYSVFSKNISSQAGSPTDNLGGNIRSIAINCDDSNELTGPDDLVGIDPLLQNKPNFHRGQDEFAPRELDSPLIDQGPVYDLCNATDFTGRPRATKGSRNANSATPARADLGAVESFETFWVSTAQDPAGTTNPGEISLRRAIARANATPGENLVLFDPDLISRKISLSRESGGTLLISEPLRIIGPGKPASSILISGEKTDPSLPPESTDFRIFEIRTEEFHLESLSISNGATLGDGGGILVGKEVEFGTLQSIAIHDCHARHGGGIAIENNPDNAVLVDLNDSSLFRNQATDLGGGFYAEPEIANTPGLILTRLNRCTVTHNRARLGGGVYYGADYTNNRSIISSSTIARNHASSAGGGIYSKEGGDVTSLSLIVRNTPDDFANSPGAAAPSEISNCILGSDPTNDPTNFTTSEPGLLDFGDHGGTTPTIAISATSPAVDFINLREFDQDQRGVVFLDGDLDGAAWPDIGAFEYVPSLITVDSVLDEDGAPADPSTSLREALQLVNKEAVIQFAPALDGQTLTLTKTLVIPDDLMVKIDANTLPNGLTISGGTGSGQIQNLIQIEGYAEFCGLRFRQSAATAIILNSSDFTHCRFRACSFVECGDLAKSFSPNFSPVAFISRGRAEFQDCRFFQNSGTASGTFLNFGQLEVVQGTFSENEASSAGVLDNFGCATFSHCSFKDQKVLNPFIVTKADIALNRSGLSGNGLVLNPQLKTYACVYDEKGVIPLFAGAADSVISLGSNFSRAQETSLNHSTDLHQNESPFGPPEFRNGAPAYPLKRFHFMIDHIIQPQLGGLPSDARGFKRALDGDGDGIFLPDPGALESPPMILVDTLADENDGIGNGSGTSLRDAVAVMNARAYEEQPFIGFDPALAGGEIALQAPLGGEILVSAETDIDASNLSANVIVAGDGSFGNHRVFQFNARDEHIRMRGINIRNGFESSANGGGIFITNKTTVDLKECEIYENFSGANGGGIAVTMNSLFTMDSCTFAQNRCDGLGGGAYVSDSSGLFAQSTFSGNIASTGGGAIADSATTNLEVLHCTMADNNSDAGAGGIQLEGQLRIGHSIVARSIPSNVELGGAANVTSLGYNLDDGTNGEFDQFSDIANATNPGIETLVFIKGKVRVIPPSFCGIAIDSGDPAITPFPDIFDQTGINNRVQDGDYLGAEIIDRGAYELNLADLPIDLDSDGMPNRFEVQNGLDPKNLLDGLADTDCDGRSNVDEYRAGTDYRDNNSFFELIEAFDVNGDQSIYEVEWTSNPNITGMLYDVSFSNDLILWTPVLINIPATAASMSTTKFVPNNVLPSGDIFVRVTARRPDTP